MSLNLGSFDIKAQNAVKLFWSTRKQAVETQKASGKTDQGSRSAVTAGKNMDGFIDLAIDIIKANGFSDIDIKTNTRLLTLPGYFRPTKNWDLLVIHNGKLTGVMEFKSQVGPSFGNNANNRCEEALGSAIDLWTAYREGAFGNIVRPFVGYLILVEDAKGSRAPVIERSPNYPIFPEFVNASYSERYRILCRKLMQEGLYTVASVILSPQNAIESGLYLELDDMTGLKTFVSTLAGYIATQGVK